MDVKVLKRALRELVEKEPAFLRDLMLDVLMVDGRVAEALLDLFTKHPEAKLRLAQAVAGAVAISLNVVTKEDLKQLGTKQDIKQPEDQMATKQDLEELRKWAEEKFATKQNLEHLSAPDIAGHLVNPLPRGRPLQVGLDFVGFCLKLYLTLKRYGSWMPRMNKKLIPQERPENHDLFCLL